MGLSDGERRNKIVWAIRGIRIESRGLRGDLDDLYSFDQDAIKELLQLIDELWHSFLGKRRNSSFWLFGGDYSNPVTHEGLGGPWSTAIHHHLEENREEPGVIRMPDMDRDRPFDPFKHSLGMDDLIPKKWQQKVASIYHWTEQLSYALRRYDDGMRRGLADLDKLISDMQGCCFEIFSGHEGFAEAYMGEKLAEVVWKHTCPYQEDPYTQALRDLNFHHDLAAGLRKLSLKKMIKLHRWWLERKPTDQNRLVLGLRIAGGKFHYDHQCQKLIEKTRGLGIRKKKIEREFAKCKRLHEKHQKEDRTSYREDRELYEMTAIHGWSIDGVLKKRREWEGE